MVQRQEPCQDGSLLLAERLYLEGHVPGPFWFTLSAEKGSVSAQGAGVLVNDTGQTYLQLKVGWWQVG